MKRMKTLSVIISLILLCSISVNLSGCTKKIKSVNLMDGVTPRQVSELNDLSTGNVKLTDFAIRIFKASNVNGTNTLISPLSILYALAMTANGANGQTLEQMEALTSSFTQFSNIFQANSLLGQNVEVTVDGNTYYGLIAEMVLSGYIEGSEIVGGTIKIGETGEIDENGNKTYAFEVHEDGTVTMSGGSSLGGYTAADLEAMEKEIESEDER